jgi:hypothetical protein
MKEGKSSIRNLTFLAGGKSLAACQDEGFVQVWAVATGKVLGHIQLEAPSRPSRPLSFHQLHVSPDGKHVSATDRIASGNGGVTRLGYWDLTTGKHLSDHLVPGQARDCVWQPDGKAAVLALPDGLTLVNIETGRVHFRSGRPVNTPVAASLDFRLCAAALAPAGRVVVWESATGKPVTTVAAGRVAHLALAANRFLVTTDEKFLRVCDLATGKERRRWALPVAMTDSAGNTFVRQLRLLPDGRRAFTALADGTALMWDLGPALVPTEPLARSSGEKELAAWWADLANADASRAWNSAWRLAEVPPQTVVHFLRKRLRAASIDVKDVNKHIADLDSDTFAVREKAYKHLEDLGNAAVPALRASLEKGPSLEVRTRLQRLLTRAAGLPLAPEVLRDQRAVGVLERLGTKAARQLLDELAQGTVHALLTQEARATQQRLSYRLAVP